MIRAGVIGWPIRHSLSPHLHGWWLKQYGIEGSYEAVPVEPEALGSFMATLRDNGFKGVNVTVPHKQAVMPYLQELSQTARRIGAVNTVVVREDGSLFGDNTDAYGFLTSLREEAPGWIPGKPVVVLGAGGAARAVVSALHEAGAQQIHIINRTPDRAAQLAQDIGIPPLVHDWSEAPALLPSAGLLVNTSVLGMTGQPPLVLPLDHLARDAIVFDLVYNPLETGLVKEARQRGQVALNGLGMLLHQAVPGFAAWFGREPQVMPAQRAALEALIA